MISAEEKEKIKDEIVDKVNSVLEKNGESFRLDKVNVLNKADTVKFMGNYRVYDRRNYDSVSREINSFLKQYGNVDIRALQELLGHESLTSTEVYTHISNEHLRDVFVKCHPRNIK